MSKLNWLHISDWHEGREEVALNRKVILEKLKEDIHNRSLIDSELNIIDCIFFTGDIAFSGKQDQFLKARKDLIDPIIKLVGVDTKIFFVPGNHDIDRGKLGGDSIPLEYNEIISNPQHDINRHALENMLSNSAKISILHSPLSSYNDFVKEYCPTFNKEELFHVEHFKKDGVTFAIIGFNTAWACGRYELNSSYSKVKMDNWDYGSIKISESQIRTALERAKPYDVGIAMMHHPINWMTEYDQIISEQLLAERCQIILHGHEHRPRINKSSGVYGDSVTIPAGALYTCRVPGDPRHRNSYNFGSFDIPSYTGKVHYRVWNEEWDRWSADERFWKGGKASFLLSNVSDEREKGAREELFELQKQFSPYIKKRIANSMTIDFQHSPIEVGGRRFLNMEIGHNIEIESGPNEVFPIVTKSNKRIIRSPIPEVRERKLELISLTPDYREVRPLDCAKSDDSEQRYEVDIGRETTEILYKYKVLETNEGVWKFTWVALPGV